MQEIKILYNFEIYKILEFGPLSDPFLVEFILKTVKDIRNPPKYYRKLSTQSIQQ
jgi:hypothetical protein